MKAKRAKVGLEIPLGFRAKELDAIQGLWHQGVDQRINFDGVWEPSLTIGGFNFEFSDGKGSLPQEPNNVERVGWHRECNMVNVSENVEEWEEVGGRELRKCLMAVRRQRQNAAEDKHSPWKTPP